MASPVIVNSQTGPRIFWTVDANVGLASPNRSDDVQLVQLGYLALMANPPTTKTPEMKAAAAKIIPGAVCSGREDDPLVTLIRAHEKSRGGAQDGRVSKFTAATVGYVDGSGLHSHIMAALCNNLADMAPDSYPRLDLNPRCPAALKAVVVKACSSA